MPAHTRRPRLAPVQPAVAWSGGGTSGRRSQGKTVAVPGVHPLVIPYTEQTAREHARIWAELQNAGKMIGYYDLIVAATAMERGSGVATFNKKHFQMVKGLNLIEPT